MHDFWATRVFSFPQKCAYQGLTVELKMIPSGLKSNAEKLILQQCFTLQNWFLSILTGPSVLCEALYYFLAIHLDNLSYFLFRQTLVRTTSCGNTEILYSTWFHSVFLNDQQRNMGSVSWTTRWMCLKISNHSFFSKLSSVWRMMSLIMDKPSLDYIVKVAPKKKGI